MWPKEDYAFWALKNERANRLEEAVFLLFLWKTKRLW